MNEDLAKAAHDIKLAVESDGSETELQDFLTVLVDLDRHPERITDDNVQMFLRDTAALVRKARVPLGDAIAAIERHVSNEFYGDEWFRVCVNRSQLQSVKDLYRELVEVNWDTFLDFENADYMMKQKGDYEGPVAAERIPPGTPSSHWWWWYPKNPHGGMR
jgi:hypothetical protein